MFEHMKHYQSRNLGAREGITGWDVLGVGVAEAIEWVCLPRERRSLGSWWPSESPRYWDFENVVIPLWKDHCSRTFSRSGSKSPLGTQLLKWTSARSRALDWSNSAMDCGGTKLGLVTPSQDCHHPLRLVASPLPWLERCSGDNLRPNCLLGAAGNYSVVPGLRGFCCNLQKPLFLVVPVSAQLQTKGTFACLAARIVFRGES